MGPLRDPTGINPLATMYFKPLMRCFYLVFLGIRTNCVSE